MTRRTLGQLLLIGALALALACALVTLWLFRPNPYTWDGYCYPGDPDFSWTQGTIGWIGSILVFVPSVVMMVRGPTKQWAALLATGGILTLAWAIVVVVLWEPTGSLGAKPNC